MRIEIEGHVVEASAVADIKRQAATGLRYMAERADGFPCRVADCIHYDEDFDQHCMAENAQRLAGPEWCRGYKPGDIE